ncbi:restriction endonuclease subunit S [Helicobacter pylori]|uniref:restriction endonuclease subunit S n=1 Tax=Helicobacter pylori TaxID=210 RepID=UPI001922C724|nr:restriction endonuclease subunit S [Helicobacter pylori]QQW89908.1 restriction endonuclease subunit S [Helicobacter pylori]
MLPLMLPLNWQRVRLGDICEITTGSLDANEMAHYGKYRFYTCAKEYYFIDKYAFDTEAILISGNGAHVGYVHYYKGKFNAYQRTYVLDNFSEHIIFVKYFLTMFLQSHIQTNRNEGNTPYIVMATLKDFEILLPPLNEQIAIANILSALDRYLYALDALILKKEGVKKALSFELLSQRKRLKGFNQAWQRVRLGDIGKPCMCKRVMKHQTTRYGEIPFYKIGTFGNTADAFISKKLFLEYKTKYSFPKKGDILISASGTIGRAVIYDGKPAYFQDSNIVWIDNDETLVKNDFLFYAYSNVKWNTEHTTILRLYNDNFRNTLIPLPPLNEQIAIANILSGLDDEIASLKNKKRQFENIKKALNHDLMSAKIRVLKK